MGALSLKASSSSSPLVAGRERSLIPVGMSTILPDAARRIRQLEQTLLAVLARAGYEEIILPMFEYLDVLAPGLESELIEKCYQLVDRTTGRLMLLRPDATAQIARTVAMGMMGERLPLRLCYRTSVFRYEREHAGRDREIFQVGAELIGVDGVTGDAEVLTLLLECLAQVGLSSFKVAVGHVGFFTALLVKAGLSQDGQKRVEQAAARKDMPLLEELLTREGVSRSTGRVILEALELAQLRGGILLTNRQSGRAAVRLPAPSVTLEDGTVERRLRRCRGGTGRALEAVFDLAEVEVRHQRDAPLRAERF